jgi:Calcineurin-like phosphoesterase superfamily domain
VRTAIVSDLHLGSYFGEDLLRDVSIRRRLLEEIASADRLVLLGDIVETRELPLPTVLEVARPFFEDVGRAMAGREVVLVPGNHDHRFAEPQLEEATAVGRGLGLEETGKPDSGAAGRIAGWLGEADAIVAYPGIWLREDVYATHGHYMDCHMSLPRIECLAAAALMRVYGPLSDPAAPEDYERVLRPIYGLSDGLAQANLAQPELVQRTRPSEQAWQAISGQDGGRRSVKRATLRAALAGGVPAAVWTLNRLLRSDFDPDLSPTAITHSGIDAATELARRLEIGAAHVITGHTHRAGPEAREEEWTLPGGGRLHNTGSWVFASAFHHPGTPPGPYWPGTVTWLEDEGPPRRVRLLNELPRDELKGIVRRAALPATRR